MAGGKNAKCTVAFSGEAALPEVGDDCREHWVVKTFAKCVVKTNAEPPVDFFKLLLGKLDDFLPDSEIFGIALLEFDEFSFGGVAEFGFVVDEFVETFEFANRVGGEGGIVPVLFPADDEHSKLRAPIADVIIGDDAVAEEFSDAGESVAENCGADVTNVHRLGNIRRTEINDDGFRFRDHRYAVAFIAGSTGDLCGDENRFEFEINEAGAGDGGWFADTGDVELLNDFLGECSRIFVARFGDGHDAVGLVIAKFRVGGPEERRCAEGAFDGVGQNLRNRWHG